MMVITQKITSLAFEIHDGKSRMHGLKKKKKGALKQVADGTEVPKVQLFLSHGHFFLSQVVQTMD